MEVSKQRRRADRRRRHFRDRRRVPPAAALPRQELRDPRGARGDRRDVGPVPLSRRPLGLRHVHARAFPSGPGRADKAIVDGAAIRAYVEETAREFGIDRHIRFGHARQRARPGRRPTARWTVEAERRRASPARFLFLAQRLLRLRAGLPARMAGRGRFRGRIVHPQFWPEDLDYAGKRVVVIGSGATAVTLVPALAETAAHVTMVQRSPTYIVAAPARDGSRMAAAWLPRRSRLRSAGRNPADACSSSTAPAGARSACAQDPRAGARGTSPAIDVERDFGPTYNPWDQRVCLVPDGDLFEAMRGGKVVDRHRRDRALHASGLELEVAARRSRRTSSSPRPGSSCGCSAASRSSVDGDAGATSPSASSTRA